MINKQLCLNFLDGVDRSEIQHIACNAQISGIIKISYL